MVPTHCVPPGVQAAPQTPALTEPLVHAPVASQVCGVVPLHALAPGVHAAPQMPSLTVPSFQLPTASQVCRIVLVHCVAPGVQTPVQAPEAQACAHGTGVPHPPPAEQVSTALEEHRVLPLLQGPQIPAPLQNAVATGHPTGAPQEPAASHVCTASLEHWVAPGTQTPVQTPSRQTNGHGGPELVHAPSAQACGWSALHRSIPGAHAA